MREFRPKVVIDLARVRANVQAVQQRTGVDVIAVVKADAYGLGIERVTRAIAPMVAGFYTFDLAEAIAAQLTRLGKPTIALVGESNNPADYLAHRVQPCVADRERAALLVKARPVLSIDTGQQRFACPVDEVEAILDAGDVKEAMTHATRSDQVSIFAALTTGYKIRRHVAGSSLLDDVVARFDAVRPGLALYHDAVRVTARLVDVRQSRGPAGYSGFEVPRFGVILAGYSHGLRPGPAAVNGQPTRILEVGMQSSFIELGPSARIGDEVTLLGEETPPADIAKAWHCTPQQVLVHLCRAGARQYVE